MQGITRAVRMTADLAAAEPIPRHPSCVYAPADPLLMGYARTWSVAEPYVLRHPAEEGDAADPSTAASGATLQLPLEAVEDGAGEVIRLKTPQLPTFLQR